MEELLIDILTDKDNISEIIIAGVIFTLGVFFRTFFTFLKWISKSLWLGGKQVLTNGKNKLKKMQERRTYIKTIKQIERMEIPVPDNFLLFKSLEKNPELKKIYQMMDDGLIEMPSIYKTEKLLDHLDLKDIKIDISKLPVRTPQLTEIKRPIIKNDTTL